MHGFQPWCLQETQNIDGACVSTRAGATGALLRGTGHPAPYLALKLVYELLEAVDLQPPLQLSL